MLQFALHASGTVFMRLPFYVVAATAHRLQLPQQGGNNGMKS
jgi:hypothetical protein